jgi:uncharacterized protein (DUF58 family)
MRSDINLTVASVCPDAKPSGAWSQRFEQQIRETASRAVAHLLRGDTVNVRATGGGKARGTAGVGADPVLRFLALLEPTRSSPTSPLEASLEHSNETERSFV